MAIKGIALIVTFVVIVVRMHIVYIFVVVWTLAGITAKQNTYPNIVLVAEGTSTIILVALALSIIE